LAVKFDYLGTYGITGSCLLEDIIGTQLLPLATTHADVRLVRA